MEQNESVNARDKGNSIIDFPSDFTIIDIETTGWDYKHDYIIEVAGMKVRNKQITDEYSSKIRPPESKEVGSFVVNLTGITNASLRKAPIFSDVASDFFDFLGDDILMGHNVNFDVNFLYDAFLRESLKLQNDYIDTLRIARKLFPDFKHHGLEDLVEHYNIVCDGMHRAGRDCDLTLQLYLKMLDDILDKHNETGAFISLFKKPHRRTVKVSEIKPETFEQDTENPLYGKECVFTGALEKMKRADAMQIVANIGGINNNSVTKRTNFLILGNNDYCSTIKDGKSTKQKKAEQLILNGQDLKIISENTFYEIINL